MGRIKEDFDPVTRPKHYNSHPSGIEPIQITRHMSFNLGNVIKYVWRADLKNGNEDLEKAAWYLNDEIKKRKGDKNGSTKVRKAEQNEKREATGKVHPETGGGRESER